MKQFVRGESEMDKNIGFIGSGKMAQAMIGGMLESRMVNKDQIFASALTNPHNQLDGRAIRD